MSISHNELVRRQRHLLKWSPYVALILVACFPCPGRANEMNTWAFLDATYSDNAKRNPKPYDAADVWYTPGISIDYLLDYPDFNATLKYRIAKSFYRNHTFSDRTDVLGEGTFKWSLIEQRLYWDFYQTRQRLTIDSLTTSTPNNQTDQDVIKTGPVLQLNFSPLNQLTIAAHYIKTQFSTDQLFASHQRQYSTTFLRSMFNENTQLGLSATYTKSLSDSIALRYISRRYGLVSHSTGKRLHYDLEIGRNTISTAGSPDTSDIYYRLSAAIAGESSSFRISANRELTDSVVGLALSGIGMPSSPNESWPTGGNEFTVNPGGDINLNGIIERRHYLSGYFYESGRASFDASLFYNRTSYLTLTRSQNSRNVQFQTRFRFSPLTSIGYRLLWSDQRVDRGFSTAQAAELKETSHRIDISYTRNPGFIIDLWIGRRNGRYQTVDIDFVELEGGLSLKYKL